jgi:K+/H+ antiporter YhaU regulatory subunit KhtT
VDIESAKGLVAVLVTDTDGEEILTSEQSKMANVMIEDSGIGQRYNLIIVTIEKGNADKIFTPSFESRIHHPVAL